MSIFFKDCYATIWKEVRSGDKYTTLQITTSEKDKKEDKWVNSSWLATAIGHAHNQIANGEIATEARTRVMITSGKVMIDTYEDKSNGEKKSTPKIVIFEFGTPDGDKTPPKKTKEVPPKKAKKTPPKELDEEKSDVISDSEELPF